MPTADSFFALGMGNGFPFCPPKVDVSGDDLWSTIDGYNKSSTGTRTAAGIAESKRLAMLYVWNTYQLTGSMTVGSDSISNVNSEDDTSSGNPLPPKSRVCLDGSDRFGDQIETDVSLALDVPLSVTAMYNGSTSNESNFIGYGITDANWDGIAAYSDDLSIGDYVWVEFKCVGPASYSDCDTLYDIEYCIIKRDSQYTTLSMGGETFHGVGVAEISNLGIGGSSSVNGNTMSASCLFGYGPDGISASASLTSLTAYSY